MSVSAEPVALFDFDHTLVRHDSFARFSRALLGRTWWRAAIAAGWVPLTAPLLPFKATRGAPLLALVWLATVGLDAARFRELLNAHVARVTKEPDRLVHRDGIERLRAHQRDGHRVVIATGAVEELARALCASLGLEDVDVVGSTLRPWGGGMTAREHCYGERKVRMLARRGYPPPWSYVYTDSAADLPLLRHGAERFLVNPSARTLRHVSRALAAPPTALHWR